DTLVGNQAATRGGAIMHLNGSEQVINCTVVGNSAGDSGGGIYSNGTTLSLENSIIAQNLDLGGNGEVAHDLRAHNPSTTIHFSLIGDQRGSNLSEAPVGSPDSGGNLVGGPGIRLINPLLGPLANNGGPTSTMALLAGSPAIESGDPDPLDSV